MELKGYGSRASLADGTLTVEASNGATKVALGAAVREIPTSHITALQLKRPTLLGNGQISVQSEVGLTLIHFLKKSSADAEAFFRALQAASTAPVDAVPSGKLANEKLDAWSEKLAADQERTRARLADIRAQRQADFSAWRSANAARVNELNATVAAAKAAHAATSAQARTDLSRVATQFREGVAAANMQFVVNARAVTTNDIVEVSSLLDAAEDSATPQPSESEILRLESDRPVTEVVDELLNLAEAAGRADDIVLEERYISDAVGHARKLGTRKDRKYAANEILRRDVQGELRVGSERLGVIRAESGLSQIARKGSLLGAAGSDAKSLEVRSDRIIAGDMVRLVDEYVSAQVYQDGHTQVIQRPTLTRMALLSPLPGSAIIAGMALQKKTTVDTRVAEFQVGSIGWQIRLTIAPSDVNGVRSIAEQLNRVAASLEKQQVATRSTADTSVAGDALTQLERLDYLLGRGVIDQDEAERLRSAILDAV